MKFYDFQLAPSPRKVRMFIHEKGLDIPSVQINLRDNEQFNEAFRKVNPRCTVPVLELDDGRTITESEAICRYLEDIHPQPMLFGNDPIERIAVNEWIRRIELDGYLAVAEALRNSIDHFKDRAIPGTTPIKQIPELAERGVFRTQLFFNTMDEALQENTTEWLAGDHFTMADIMAFIAVEFAQRVRLSPDPEKHATLLAWHQRVAQRPSAQL